MRHCLLDPTNAVLTYDVSRVCEIKLLGNHEFSLRQQKYRVSDALKTGEASALFGAFP